MQDDKSKELEIPVSLGKPSLRRRLEAYYSLINPESIQDTVQWRSTFRQIFEKYGGSYEGERKLASKLAKKYGTTVRLLLAESVMEKKKVAPEQPNSEDVREEAWFALRPQEEGSGVVDFTSPSFDPKAALQAPENTIVQENAWLSQCPVLSHVDQFRSHLPQNDPLFRSAPVRPNNTPKQTQTAEQKPKKLGPFAAIAEHHTKGPFSFLHRLFEKRQRVRVLIRYVNSIRGTLTGYIVAYDKHCNLILRDVDEVYSPRRQFPSMGEEGGGKEGRASFTNLQAEMNRRARALKETQSKKPSSSDGDWQVRQRHMKQILVRGDNVVMVYKAESERSAWPQTAKSPTKSVHGRKPKVVPEAERVGSPGSLIYSLQQQSRRRSQSKQRCDYQSSKG